MQSSRSVFFISDRTGVTAENFGISLLNQFGQIKFKSTTVPFVDTPFKAQQLIENINTIAKTKNQRVIVFSSIISEHIRRMFDNHAYIFHIDVFDSFIPMLEQEFDTKAHMVMGLTHSIVDETKYDARIHAVNFALENDDGITDKNFSKADVILVGVSRSGKTPTCLYLALQYGILMANYPLTPDDLHRTELPNMLKPYRNKLFGLTIEPLRLNRIRTERRPNSTYASLHNCQLEINEAESMFRQHGIPFLNSTHKSVEELAASILQITNIQRRC
ncbi:posphoenolpyruvate synthetase regulatory kinase/phosphorylase PpsR [Zophobihabitans entericus]|uniref:Putative phosphoenolpyruvate synthase regulatory protein n=1 Tax=Zophobihabitans entericus TaxID=1635327 RepID=A0A6G9I9Z8_9GAMM|nr:pyruvate, water dikinase regulatory protein [Zophobihabitans entericus]QIQ21058.1 kinase/pyrophosphorylase [Zophobihabitans entericus]